jgi:hypothetical protein
LAGVLDPQALALIDHERENVGTRAGALAQLQRFQQAERQREHAGQFEQSTTDPNAAFDGTTVAGPNQGGGQENEERQNWKHPPAGGKDNH